MKTQYLKFIALVALILVTVAQVAIIYAASDASPDHADAIAAVLAKDSRLGATRNDATRRQPIALVVKDYVEGLDAIDLQYCPEEFTTALRRHRDAWHDSIGFFRQFDDLRGELHEVFEMIRAMDEPARAGLEKAESEIFSTWAEVEKAAGAISRTQDL